MSSLFPLSSRQRDANSPATGAWRTTLSLALQYAARQSAAHAALTYAAMHRCLKELERIGALTESEALAEADALPAD